MSRPSLILPIRPHSSYLYHSNPPSTPSIATLPANAAPTLVLTLWVHDDFSSKQETYINTDLFPAGSVHPGDIISVRPVEATSPHDGGGQAHGRGDERIPMSVGGATPGGGQEKNTSGDAKTAASGASGGGRRGKSGANRGAEFLFVVREREEPPSIKGMQGVRDLQISVSSQVAALFGFRPRMAVVVTVVSISELGAGDRPNVSRRKRVSMRLRTSKSSSAISISPARICGA